MGTDLYVAIGHSLDTIQISNLPISLNQHFADHIDKIQMRISHGYSGNLLSRDNNDWVWEVVDELDWDAPHELEGENLWTWIDKPKPTESFEQSIFAGKWISLYEWPLLYVYVYWKASSYSQHGCSLGSLFV